jgi:hypothetical protein
MSEPLKYKVEKSISAFLAAQTDLSAFNQYQGQNPGETAPPAIIVFASSMQEAWPNSLPKSVAITVEVVSAIDTDSNADSVHGASADRTANWSTHRTAVAVVEEKMRDLEQMRRYVLPCFHIYDVQEDSQQSTLTGDDRMMISVIGFTVTCEGQQN